MEPRPVLVQREEDGADHNRQCKEGYRGPELRLHHGGEQLVVAEVPWQELLDALEPQLHGRDGPRQPVRAPPLDTSARGRRGELGVELLHLLLVGLDHHRHGLVHDPCDDAQAEDDVEDREHHHAVVHRAVVPVPHCGHRHHGEIQRFPDVPLALIVVEVAIDYRGDGKEGQEQTALEGELVPRDEAGLRIEGHLEELLVVQDSVLILVHAEHGLLQHLVHNLLVASDHLHL
mmetsp:Transcript_103745/g.334478  ORF Transcript_103745/g.334478 Transcript_103745/m.334478 type:complete len:232 (+) Transcript_103745:1476-2171(+)